MSKKLIVSADCDGLIKIWNFAKELVREIKFTEPISAVCFLNPEADLLVGHRGKLSRIYAKDYLPYNISSVIPSDVEIHKKLDEMRSVAMKLAIESDKLARSNSKGAVPSRMPRSKSTFASIENFSQIDLS